jgi:hypothetical protein
MTMSHTQDKVLSEGTVDDYMKMYQATVNLLTDSVIAFNSLATRSPLAADRELFRAKALEANREHELLTSKMRAFLKGDSLIRRPTHDEIVTAQGLAQKLADLIAKHAKAEAMVKLVNDAVDKFNSVSDAA